MFRVFRKAMIRSAVFCTLFDRFNISVKISLIEINHDEAIAICDAAGDFFIVPCTTGTLNVSEIKQICEDFEENHPLGRFIDVDLNDDQGNTISSGKSKLCFFCQDKPAIECRRENAP